MADLQFSNEDLTAFAELSGDHNPLHVNISYAKRSLFGRQVVHGTLVAIKLIHAISAGRMIKLDSIEARFLRPIYLNRRYHIDIQHSIGSRRVSVYSGDTLQVQVLLEFTESNLGDLTGITQVQQMLLRKLGLCPSFLSPVQLRALLKVSEYTGMSDPGTPALLSRFEISFSEAQIGKPLNLTAETDERFNTRKVSGSGAGMLSLEIDSLIREQDQIFDFNSLRDSQTNHWKLDGKTVAITGASSPFGKTLAAIVGLNGGNLVLHARKFDSEMKMMTNELRKFGRSVHIIEGDLEEISTSEKIMNTLSENADTTLVLNAFVRGPSLGFLEQTEAEFSDTFTRAIAATLKPLRIALNTLDEGSKIIFVSSTYTSTGHARLSPYVAAKAAIEGVLRSLAFETPRPTLINLRLPPLETAGDVNLNTEAKRAAKISPAEAAHAVISRINHTSLEKKFIDETIER